MINISRTCLSADSVYSERYMGRPGATGNFKGYGRSDVVSSRAARGHFRPGGARMARGRARTKNPPLRKLYLVHGTRDDNVHLQHTAVLSSALVKDGVSFRQQVLCVGGGRKGGLRGSQPRG